MQRTRGAWRRGALWRWPPPRARPAAAACAQRASAALACAATRFHAAPAPAARVCGHHAASATRACSSGRSSDTASSTKRCACSVPRIAFTCARSSVSLSAHAAAAAALRSTRLLQLLGVASHERDAQRRSGGHRSAARARAAAAGSVHEQRARGCSCSCLHALLLSGGRSGDSWRRSPALKLGPLHFLVVHPIVPTTRAACCSSFPAGSAAAARCGGPGLVAMPV